MTDPYITLGVPKTSSQDEIRSAFRKLARKFHPDVNKTPGAEARFKSITEAHEVLGDAQKRALYDEFGEESVHVGFNADQARAFRRGGGMGGFGGGGFGAGAGGVNFEDLLRGYGGGGRGRDVEGEVSVSLLDTLRGAPVTVSVNGQNVTVTLPVGIADGKTLRVAGKGQPGRAGPGDLLLHIVVTPHPELRRIGDDLEMDVPVSLLEALVGGKITVPLPLGGSATLPLSAGVKNGQRLRLRGKGVKGGDLHVIVRPVMPEVSDPALAERVARELGGDKDVRAGWVL